MRLLLFLALLILDPVVAAAQGWTLDLYGGRVAYDLVASSPSEYGGLLGIRYSRPKREWLYASTGIPFGSDDSTWGAAGAGARLAHNVGRVEVGVGLGAHGWLHRDPLSSSGGRGGLLDVRPLIAVNGKGIALEGRSGWVRYGTSFRGAGVTRDVLDSDLRTIASLGREVQLAGIVRHVRAEEDSYTYGGGRLTVHLGRVMAWGAVGSWASDALPNAEWQVGASLGLDQHDQTSLRFSVREDAPDPVYWNALRRRWSLGVSHTFGSRRLPGPRARGRDLIGPEIPAGRVTIRIPIEGSAAPPSVAGDFTGWRPIPMVRQGTDWSASFEIGPGVYHYSFRSPSGEWYVPESIPSRRPDGMGGFVAVLVVS